MTIHREGNKILIGLSVLLIVINGIYFLLLPTSLVFNYFVPFASIVLFLLVLQFFRNPTVAIEVNDNHVLAPADGKVVVVEKTNESEFFKDERIQVSIFMSPLNVHVNRSPVTGNIKYYKYHPGKYLVAWHPKSSTDNERTTMVVTMKNGADLLVRQIAGAVARRIKFYKKEGDVVDQGQEFGFIRFGSRLDVFLPLDAKIEVELNHITKAGRTVIAKLS